MHQIDPPVPEEITGDPWSWRQEWKIVTKDLSTQPGCLYWNFAIWIIAQGDKWKEYNIVDQDSGIQRISLWEPWDLLSNSLLSVLIIAREDNWGMIGEKAASLSGRLPVLQPRNSQSGSTRGQSCYVPHFSSYSISPTCSLVFVQTRRVYFSPSSDFHISLSRVDEPHNS